MEHRNSVSRDLSTLYPVSDSVQIPAMLGTHATVRARWTGEVREPRAGEWYLCGSIVKAYRALSDLSRTFHIAMLVTATVTWTEVQQHEPERQHIHAPGVDHETVCGLKETKQ